MHTTNCQPQTKRVLGHIADEYGVEPEFLWPEQSPSYCVFRNSRDKKWFGIVMVIPGNRLGLGTDKDVDIVDLKFDDEEALDFAHY